MSISMMEAVRVYLSRLWMSCLSSTTLKPPLDLTTLITVTSLSFSQKVKCETYFSLQLYWKTCLQLMLRYFLTEIWLVCLYICRLLVPNFIGKSWIIDCFDSTSSSEPKVSNICIKSFTSFKIFKRIYHDIVSVLQQLSLTMVLNPSVPFGKRPKIPSRKHLIVP